MSVKQLSVFVENKAGRLSAITNILGSHGISLRAVSIADTQDFGILRIIVPEPQKAYDILKEQECTVSLTDVVAVALEDKAGTLAKAVEVLYDGGISIEYVYGFIAKVDNTAYIIFRVDDNGKAEGLLNVAGFELLSDDDIKNI
jgi:hypothetical protein